MKNRIIPLLLISFMLAGCGNSTTEKSDDNLTSDKTTVNTKSDDEKEDAETTTETSLVSKNRKTDVRDFCWGDTMEIAKEVEKEELLYETDNDLLYEVELCGYTVNMRLAFDEKYGLYDVTYISDDSGGVQASVMLNKYYDIVDRISDKYGNPSHSEKKLSSLADYCDSTAEAIKSGYVAVSDIWENVYHTNINGIIARSDYKVVFMFQFSSADFDKPKAEAGF